MAPVGERALGSRSSFPVKANDEATGERPIAVWMSWLGLLGLIGTLLVTGAAQDKAGVVAAAWLYLVANVILMLGVVLSIRSGAVALLVAFFFTFFVAVPALVQIQVGVYPFGRGYAVEPLVGGLEVLATGQGAYVLVRTIMGRRSPAPTRRRRARPPAELVRTLSTAASVLLVINIMCLLYVGVDAALVARFDHALAGQPSGVRQQVLLAGRSLSLLGILICLALWRGGSEARWLPLPLARLLGSAFVFGLLNFPSALPRFQLLGAVIALSVIFVPMHRVSVKALASVLAPLFLLFLFPVVKALGVGSGGNYRSSFGGSVRQYLLSADFDSFKQTVDTWIWVQGNPERNGENFLGVLLFWVPRSIWGDKPTHSGQLVSSSLGYPFTNVASPLPAEGFISWGMVGTIFAMGLLGLIVSGVERRALRMDGDLVGLLGYALLAGFITIILRGALGAVAPMLGPGFVVWGVINVVTRRKSAAVAGSAGSGHLEMR